MKFGDKLVELRKKNGYSQEELAEKLGVSRQSVSKWESNNTYPETDKIVQIANIFDCSMDDLINDKITDVETTLRKNKNNIYNIWDSLLEFITKSINMFSKMNFSTGFKCIIEMVILGFLLGLFGHIVCGLLSELIANIFSFINHDVVFLIKQILYGVFCLIWFIIGTIVVIHTFKIRYLNYYDEVNTNNSDNNDTNNIDGNDKDKNANITNTKKDEKIIIRDEKDKPFAFLSTLSKIVIIFIKFMAFWFLVGVVCTAVGFVVGGVLSLAYIPTNMIFLWLFVMMGACSVVSIQVILLLINFIFNRKTNAKRHIIIFISSVVVFGFSIAMTLLTFKNIELIDDNSQFELETKEINLDYKDDLSIVSNGLGVDNEYKYVIDNSIEGNNIIVSRSIDPKFFELYYYESKMDMMPIITVEEDNKNDFKLYYDFIIKNLKKNKIYTFSDYGNDPLIIRANEDTINKLIGNLKKLYLISEDRVENTINVTIIEDKVYFMYGVEGSYDARSDSIIYNEGIENYSCKKEIENTKYGDKITYICDYTDR